MGRVMAVKSVLEAIHEVKFEVDSRYTVLETIGNGAYGVVCSAFDNQAKSKVAIKKISRIFDIPTIAKRTLRELKILKHLNHHNIISIKDILRPPEDINNFQDVYVVLDLMESDLHHIIYSKQVLSEDHVRFFLYQMLCGLKYIHSAGLLHRDLKPSNLLVNANCELRIGDFGMARCLDSSPTEQKRVMTEYVQTRWYRAPELMLSVHKFNTGIDMWSVGCIFAEMLARRPLFPGSNYLNQLQLILSVVGLPSQDFISSTTSDRVRTYISKLPHKDPVPLKNLFPSTTAKALQLLGCFLKLDPGERYSAEEALEAPFLSMYHNLDDEPTCAPLHFDFDAIPLEKNALRASILNEILHTCTSGRGVTLTPVTSGITPSAGQATCSSTMIGSRSQGNQSIISVHPVLNDDHEAARKRKHCKSKRDCKVKRVKDQTEKDCQSGENLSEQDKKMLERWTNMQKTTKPFVHPIRKHMNELMQLKAQSVTQPQTVNDGCGVSGINTVASKHQVQFQFTNFVPIKKDGEVALVKDTPKVDQQPKGKVTASLATGHKAVLVPVGSIPCYRIEGPFKSSGQLVIIQPAAQKTIAGPTSVAKTMLTSETKVKDSKVVPVAAVAPVASSQFKPAASFSTQVNTGTAKSKSTEVATHKCASTIVEPAKSFAKSTVNSSSDTPSKEQSDSMDDPVTISAVVNRASAVKLPTTIDISSSSKISAAPTVTEVTTKSQNLENVSRIVTRTTPSTLSLQTNALPNIAMQNKPCTASYVLKLVCSQISSATKPGISLTLPQTITSCEENPSSSTSSEKSASTECTVASRVKFSDKPSLVIKTCNNDSLLSYDSSVSHSNITENSEKDSSNEALLSSCIPTRQISPRGRAILQLIEQFQSPKIIDKDDDDIHTHKVDLSTNHPKIDSGEETTTSDTYSNKLSVPELDVTNCDDSTANKRSSVFKKDVQDVLMTTLMTPKTPKSGACGYGLGFDLEELLNQTTAQEFWNTPCRPSDASTSNGTDETILPVLSASLLNDWLDGRNIEPSDMEELQKELESTSSSLLFDS